VRGIFIQTPLSIMQRALKIFPWIIKPPVRDGRLLIAKIVEWSNIARKQGLLGLEMMIEREPDDFVQKALQLVVDGNEPDNISSVMYVDLNMREHADTTAAKVFEAWASTHRRLASSARCWASWPCCRTSPTRASSVTGSPPHHRDGVRHRSCKPLFLPVAAKLKVIIARQTQFREMVVDACCASRRARIRAQIEAKLQGYLH